MRRLTRRIGLFGGPAATMSAMGVEKKPAAKPSSIPAKPEVRSADATDPIDNSSKATKKPSWFRRIWGPKRDPES